MTKYITPPYRGECTLEKEGGGNEKRIHQNCICINSDKEICKTFCDQDVSCKGYTEHTQEQKCQIATTSKCPSGCNQTNNNSFGDLRWKNDDTESTDWLCFVKEKGSSSL